jgi:hypothetical protein
MRIKHPDPSLCDFRDAIFRSAFPWRADLPASAYGFAPERGPWSVLEDFQWSYCLLGQDQAVEFSRGTAICRRDAGTGIATSATIFYVNRIVKTHDLVIMALVMIC